MLNKINCFNTYIALWGFYILQGTFYESGGVLSQSLLVIIIVVSVFNVYKANCNYALPSYFKITNALLVLITIYGLLRYNQGDWDVGFTVISWFAYLKSHYISIMPIYAFYVYSMKGQITTQKLKWVALLFFIIYVFYFIRIQTESSLLTNRDEVTNNSAYMFVSLLLLLPLFRVKPIVGYLIAIAISSFVLMSAKRGAIILCIMCIVLFVWYNIRNTTRTFKVITIGASVVFILVAGYAANEFIQSNDYLLSRLAATQSGNSSGRDRIYASLIKNLNDDDSSLHFLFGRGADSTFHIAGNFAHNDWLEIATNMGILGVIVYLFYWIKFYKSVNRMKCDNSVYYAFLMVFAFCFIRAFFSMSINDMSTITTLVIGYCLAYPSIIANKIKM